MRIVVFTNQNENAGEITDVDESTSIDDVRRELDVLIARALEREQSAFAPHVVSLRSKDRTAPA